MMNQVRGQVERQINTITSPLLKTMAVIMPSTSMAQVEEIKQ